MATPNLVMQKPYALIEVGASQLSGVPSGTGLNFGTIALIYQTSDNYEIGDDVSYNPAGQTLIAYDNVEYAMVREEFILNKEIPPS